MAPAAEEVLLLEAQVEFMEVAVAVEAKAIDAVEMVVKEQ